MKRSEVQVLLGPPGSTLTEKASEWGLSSVGRAPALQAGGQGFDPPSLHKVEGPVRNGWSFCFKVYSGFEGNPMRKLIPIALAIILTATVSGCSSNGPSAKADPTESPTTSPTESAKQAFDSIAAMEQGKPKLAQNDLDVEFLDIAFASCKKALEDGLIIEDEESTSYFVSDPNSIFSIFKIKEVSVTNGVVAGGKYMNYYPALFDPCDTMVSATMVGPEDDNYAILEHSLEKTTAFTYKWGQHHGGASLDVITYTVGSDGLISGYSTPSWASKISYGPLSETEL